MRYKMFYILMMFATVSFYAGSAARAEVPAKDRSADLVKRLSSEFLDERQKARDELVAMGKSAEPLLLEALKSTDARVRAMAASALGGLRSEKALPALIAALQDKEGAVRLEALSALGKIPSPEALRALVSALDAKEESAVDRAQSAITESIALQPDAAVAILLDRAAKSKQDEILFLGKTLAAFGKKIVPPLIEMLSKTYPRCDVAHEALFIIGFDSAPELIKVMEGDNALVMRSAALLLGELRSPDALPCLIKCLEGKSRFPLLRANCALALGWIKDAKAIPALITALKDDDPEVRSFAADALGNMKAKTAVPALIELVGDKNFRVRVSAIIALSDIKDRSCTETLIKALEDEYPAVQRAAAWALGMIKAHSAASALKKRIDDDDLILRLVAAKSLAQLGDESGAEAIIRALHHWNGDTRRIAAYHAALIRDSRPVEPLIKLLDDDYPYAKQIALLSLRRLTGQNLPADRQAWTEWYNQNKNTLKIKSEEDTYAIFKAERALQAGDLSNAMETYKKILEIDPNSAVALNNLAWIYATSENEKFRHPAEALKMALRAVEVQPIAPYYDTLAEAFFVNGQINEAIDAEKKAMELQPTDRAYYEKRIETFQQALNKKK